MFSSLHAQNVTLSDFLNQETDIPLVSQLPNKVFMSTLRMGRDYLLSNSDLESGHNKFHSLDERLMESTIAITDHQLCPVSQSASHILRIMSRLWRSLVCGNGEPNLAWSNPGTACPLRTHAFATIVHLVGATSLYLAKNGLTQVDSTKKWNVVTFGRVLALLFNEGSLFGSQSVEKFDEAYWSTPEALNPSPVKQKSPAKKSVPKRRRHFRNNYDLFNDMPPREAPKSHSTEMLCSTAGDLATPPQKRAVLTMAALSASKPDSLCHDYDPDSPKRERRVDSKMDFQQAFRAANSGADGDLHSSQPDTLATIKSENGTDDSTGISTSQTTRNGGSTGNAGKAFVQAFGDVAGNGRRWMTAPTNILLTIPESENGDDSDDDLNVSGNDTLSSTLAEFAHPAIDGDVADDLEKRDVVKQPPKQMRRPRRPAKQSDEPVETITEDIGPPTTPLLLTSDDDIETKGTAFLDTIGSSIGMR